MGYKDVIAELERIKANMLDVKIDYEAVELINDTIDQLEMLKS